ncbi:MAG: hypothetical protein AAGJ46_04645 [Planctomycetota bacterium]
MLYIASDGEIPAIAWNPLKRAVHTETLSERTRSVVDKFSLPEVRYIGSDKQCGCGYRWAMLQNGEWPEADYRGQDWYEEQLDEDEGDKRSQEANHDQLGVILMGLMDASHSVELYGCWSGEEGAAAKQTIATRVSELVEPNSVFRERCKYQIKVT